MKKSVAIDIILSLMCIFLCLVFKGEAVFAISNGILILFIIIYNVCKYRCKNKFSFPVTIVSEAIICWDCFRIGTAESLIILLTICFVLACFIVILIFVNVNTNFLIIVASVLIFSVVLFGQVQCLDYTFPIEEKIETMTIEDKYIMGMYGFYDYLIDLDYYNESICTIEVDKSYYNKLNIGDEIEVTVIRGFLGYHYLIIT